MLAVAAMVAIGAGLLGGPLVQSAYAANSADSVCAGIATVSGAGCSGSDTSINKVVGTAINIFSIIIGVIAVIMIMVSGFKYITANGDSGQLGSAKNTLIYAIVGLVIVALSQSIVHFVLTNVKK
jgi:hypothetical protein